MADLFLEFVIDESSFINSFQDANIKIWNISWPNWRHLRNLSSLIAFYQQDTDLNGWFVYFGTHFLLTPYVLLTLALTRWNYYVAVVWAHAWWSCVVYDWLHVDDCGFLCVMASLVSDVTLWWEDCLVRCPYLFLIFIDLSINCDSALTLGCRLTKNTQWKAPRPYKERNWLIKDLIIICQAWRASYQLVQARLQWFQKIFNCWPSNQPPSGQREIN